MLDTLTNVSLTTLMVVIGPVLLAIAIGYGLFALRHRSRSMKEHSDQATRRLYRDGAERERRTEQE